LKFRALVISSVENEQLYVAILLVICNICREKMLLPAPTTI